MAERVAGKVPVPLCASSKVMWEPSTKTAATKEPQLLLPWCLFAEYSNYSQGEGLAWHHRCRIRQGPMGKTHPHVPWKGAQHSRTRGGIFREVPGFG